MERFAELITAGGLALVAGLWLTALVATGSLPWLAGAALALAGAVGLGAGIWTELDVDVREA
ncbi:hypothetical protein HWV07_15030 [Natronomonas salina]|uniref:hypothetical protein n=1 Tax=Natronomonas salina TaxID=1710540 RepID=UPI0015B44DD2|nr:hypothetical protein [Natronomonas salina]QLD90276.1 hypothetical protein HWV07_15030 [Natronomonas salina]